MPTPPSFAGRALIALGLMVGFYLLALAIAGALFFLPYAEWTYGGRLHIKLALVCVVAGGLVVWSILPRIDRFVAPGPRLKRAEQPRLFAEIESIAQATGQAMPAEVYLVGDVNAWVSQRGGVLGFGSRRIMGLGLPLMGVLTRAQMRAVLAHEFGHFHGGDTRLGPLVYRTRAAIERTLVNLSNRDGSGSALQAPFRWYGQAFLRITHTLSRQQEYSADALAARTVSAQALIDGLRSLSAADHAFQSYWESECNPVLAAGFLPPLADGFGGFLAAENVSLAVKAAVAKELASPSTPYDTHPPLSERIGALERYPKGEPLADDPPALSLLDDVPTLERNWLTLLEPSRAKDLQPITWNSVGAEVYVPHWRKLLRVNAPLLRGVRLAALSAGWIEVQVVDRKFIDEFGECPSDAGTLTLVLCTAALSVALLQRGATLNARLGQPLTLMLGGETIDLCKVVSGLADKTIPQEEWLALCARHGVSEVDLGELEASA